MPRSQEVERAPFKWKYPSWGHFAGAALIVAGLMKLLVFPEFAKSVRTWSMLPEVAQTGVTILLPPFELGLGTALFLRPRSIRLLTGFVLLMVLFTAAYSLQLFAFGKPECACLGLLAAYSEHVSDSPLVIGRNMALASIGVIGLCRAWKDEA